MQYTPCNFISTSINFRDYGGSLPLLYFSHSKTGFGSRRGRVELRKLYMSSICISDAYMLSKYMQLILTACIFAIIMQFIKKLLVKSPIQNNFNPISNSTKSDNLEDLLKTCMASNNMIVQNISLYLYTKVSHFDYLFP